MTRSVYSLPICGKLAGLLLAALVAPAVDLSADSGSRHPASSQRASFPPIVFIQAAKTAGAREIERSPEGSRMVLLAAEAKKPVVLTADFFAAADPQVDFDGKRVLFAAQKARAEHWQIWEMNLDGSGVRQITKCEADCVRPAYLPAAEVVFTRLSAETGRQHSSLQIIGLDGTNSRPVTFGPGEWWLETVLRDGRILASANSPLADGAGNRLLYTLRPDGTGLESFRCEHTGLSNRGEATELEDGTVVFTKGSGLLMAVRRGRLQEEEIGAAGNTFRSPGSLGESSSIIVADRPANALHYQVAIVPADRRSGVRTIFSDTQFDSIQPVAVQARPAPKKFWSNLIASSSTGYFISLDSSNSMDKAKGGTPIRRVRVIAQKTSSEVVLGDAPVETDGSFYVKVPANRPVRFVLLDNQGKVIREEQSWVWARPGEQRGCTGCHGDKALAPENRWPLALRRKDPPTLLGGESSGVQTVESHGH